MDGIIPFALLQHLPGIGLGVTHAATGQMIRASGVDADGKPTGWEPIDGVEIVTLRDGTMTLADLAALLANINATGRHVFFDTAALAYPLYLCTIAINYDDEGQLASYRLNDLVTGRVAASVWSDNKTLAEVLAEAHLPAAYPTHIAVTTPPTKTLYEIGNDFDTTGMVVTLYWSNGYTETVDNADLVITPSTFSVAAEQQSVLLTYTVTPYVLTATLVVEVRDIIPDTWAKVQQIVRAGRMSEYFSVAEEKTTTLGTATKVINVAGFDEMAPVEAGRTHSLTLIADDAWGTMVFDPPQFLYAIRAEDWPDGMPAGTYNIGYATSASARTYVKFTTTKTVPVGGGFTLSGDLVAGSTLTSRTEDTVTTIESGLALSAAADATDGTPLGVAAANNRNLMSGAAVNFVDRARYGGNRWSTAYFRQWAHSNDAVVDFKPATIWSRRPNLTDEGLLHRMDPELVAVLGRTRTRYAIPNCDGGGYEDIEDTVTIPTMLDLNFGNNSGVVEGPVSAGGTVLRSTPLSLYVGATNEDRIWYNGASASSVWLSSSYPALAHYERIGAAAGSLSDNIGQYAGAVVPRLTII